MRYVSHIRKFGVQIVEPRVHITQYGDRVVDREGYTALFNQNDLTDRDKEVAEQTFEFRGLTTMIDEVTPTPLLDRISVFDTDEEAARGKWQPEFKLKVEERLAEINLWDPEFTEVFALKVPPPWPNYMDWSGSLEQLIATLVMQGHNLYEVIEFERQTGHRQAVIDALQEKLSELEAETADAPEVEG